MNLLLIVSSLDCNFEKDNCKWNVQQEFEYMWTVISGGTHHNDTGPVVDHTYGFCKLFIKFYLLILYNNYDKTLCFRNNQYVPEKER